jgi:hypothetical protein
MCNEVAGHCENSYKNISLKDYFKVTYDIQG